MRAPLSDNPLYAEWEDTAPPAPDTAPSVTVFVDEEEGECLVDQRGEPLFVEAPPFGFCSQKEDDDA